MQEELQEELQEEETECVCQCNRTNLCNFGCRQPFVKLVPASPDSKFAQML